MYHYGQTNCDLWNHYLYIQNEFEYITDKGPLLQLAFKVGFIKRQL